MCQHSSWLPKPSTASRSPSISISSPPELCAHTQKRATSKTLQRVQTQIIFLEGYTPCCHTGSREVHRVAERTDLMLSCCKQRRLVSWNLGFEGCGVSLWQAGGGGGRKSGLRAVEVEAISLHTHTLTHTQSSGLGSIPAHPERRWANQIINLQELNFQACVHTLLQEGRNLSSLWHTYTSDTKKYQNLNWAVCAIGHFVVPPLLWWQVSVVARFKLALCCFES